MQVPNGRSLISYFSFRTSRCYSVSVTPESDAFRCRLGSRYDEPRTNDAGSEFYYRELPAGEGISLSRISFWGNFRGVNLGTTRWSLPLQILSNFMHFVFVIFPQKRRNCPSHFLFISLEEYWNNWLYFIYIFYLHHFQNILVLHRLKMSVLPWIRKFRTEA